MADYQSIYVMPDCFPSSKSTLGTTRRVPRREVTPRKRPEQEFYRPPPKRTYSVVSPDASMKKTQVNCSSFEPRGTKPQRPGFEGSKVYTGGPHRPTPKTHDNSTGTGRASRDQRGILSPENRFVDPSGTKKNQLRAAMLHDDILDIDVDSPTLVLDPGRRTSNRVKRQSAEVPNNQNRRHIRIAEDEDQDTNWSRPSRASDLGLMQTNAVSSNIAQPIEIDSDEDGDNQPNSRIAVALTEVEPRENEVRSVVHPFAKRALPPGGNGIIPDQSGSVTNVHSTMASQIHENGNLQYPDSDEELLSTKVHCGGSEETASISSKGNSSPKDDSPVTRSNRISGRRAVGLTKSPYFTTSERPATTQPARDLQKLSDHDEDSPVLMIKATQFNNKPPQTSHKDTSAREKRDKLMFKFAIEGSGGNVQSRRINWSLIFSDDGFSFQDGDGRVHTRSDIDYDLINSWTIEDSTYTISIILKTAIPFYHSGKSLFITLKKIDGNRFIGALQTFQNTNTKMAGKYRAGDTTRLIACRESCRALMGNEYIETPLGTRKRDKIRETQNTQIQADRKVGSPLPLTQNAIEIDASSQILQHSQDENSPGPVSKSAIIYDIAIKSGKTPTPISLPQGRDMRNKQDERHLLVDKDEVGIGSSKRYNNDTQTSTNETNALGDKNIRNTRSAQRSAEEKVVRDAKSHEPLLIYPNIKGQNSVTLYEEDLERLRPDEFLNDSIVEFHLKYNYDQLPERQKVEAHIFNTFFYQRLTQRKDRSDKEVGYAAVRKWTSKGKGVDLFSKKFVVIPINENLHWYLAVIVNLDNIEFGEDVTRKAEVSFIQIPESDETLPDNTTNSSRFDLTDNVLADIDSDDSKAIQNLEPLSAQEETVQNDCPQAERVVETPPPVDQVEKTASIIESRPNMIPLPEDARSSASSTLEAQTQVPQEKPHINVESVPVVDRRNGEGGADLGRLTIEDDESDAARAPLSTPRKKLKIKKQTKTYSKIGKHISEDTPTIIILDSLGNSHTRVYQILKDYLVAEAKDKKNEILNPSQIATCKADVPSQDNFSDCGLFLIQYADTLLRQPGVVKNLLNRVAFQRPEAQQAHKRRFENTFNIDRIPSRRKEMIEHILKLSGPYREQARAEDKQRKLEKLARMKAERESGDGDMMDVKPADSDISCAVVPHASPNDTDKTCVTDDLGTVVSMEGTSILPEDKSIEAIPIVHAKIALKSPHFHRMHEDSIDELDFL